MYGPKEAFEMARRAKHLLDAGWTPEIHWTDDGPHEKWTKGGDVIEIDPNGRVRSTLRGGGGSLHDILFIVNWTDDAAEYTGEDER